MSDPSQTSSDPIGLTFVMLALLGIPFAIWLARRDPAEQVAGIVGCRYVRGACVVHQRAMDVPRPGCPFVDSMMRYAKAGTR